MTLSSVTNRLWISRWAAIWCVAMAFPGLWPSERVRHIKRFSGWARAPLYLAILMFNFSDFGTYFSLIDERSNEDGNLQNLLLFATLTNGLFPVVDVGVSSLLRSMHLKLCQPWQWHYLAIHGLIAVPSFYTAASLLVLILSARSPYLWPGDGKINGFLTPIGTVGPALVLFMAVFQLSALALLIFHPGLGLPERYEPLAVHRGTKRLVLDPIQPGILPTRGFLASRFQEQESRMTKRAHQHDAIAMAQLHVPAAACQSTENEEIHTAGRTSQPGKANPASPAPEMDFYDSLKSWATLSSVERAQASNLRILVVVATLLDTVAGWVYFGITIRLPAGPESCPSARCIYGVVLPIVGVLLTWLVTYVTFQRKGRVARIHVIALFALSLVFFGLGIYLGTILVRASGSGALAERARILRIALTVTGGLTAAAIGLFVFIPILFHIAQSWGVHISGIK
ncbi:hypothetical protein B0T18DRAFT_185724 [Schizothecium vesticola]|uniref:Uncharacterized protein n=1 Tax=Schizothecium vesticola TaxID=314040 RepID=A0AA40EQC1_9PEZI|nr:hypothetical protein B0T18DRAFT_185724 [Schizothecium vesticola]